MNQTIKCIEMLKNNFNTSNYAGFLQRAQATGLWTLSRKTDHEMMFSLLDQVKWCFLSSFYDQSLNSTSELCDMKMILYFIEGVELHVPLS